MIREDLVAERIAIDSYRQMARNLGRGDPTTRRLLQEILANEEEHAKELASLLQNASCGGRAAQLRRASARGGTITVSSPDS
jgi:bacterioferritin